MSDVDLRAIANAYESGAWEYAAKFGADLVTNHFDRGVLDRVLEELAPRSLVLDVGCGPAQISHYVRGREHRAVSVDLTFEMLQVARQRGADTVARADVRRLPIVLGCADLAVCWYSLHNLPRDTMTTTLSELKRTLRPGGRLVVATHGGAGEEWHDAVVVTYYSKDELLRLCESIGFRDVQVVGRGPQPHEHQVEKLYLSARV